ncbi:MAG: hypothetical protein WA192_13105 [Candidatus Acidiferrales bacterium]
MRRAMGILGAWVLAATFAATAMAQGTGRMDGQILDKDGKPYADVTVTIKNPDTGQVFTEKTDKNGKFVQLGIRTAIYIISLPDLGYSEKFAMKDGEETDYKLDLKAVAAATEAAHPEEEKKKEEAENKFTSMKKHFDAGTAALTAANELQTQIRTAPADQKATLQEQRSTDCATAASEFQQAAQGLGEKDVNNHAMILGNLGAANECAGKYDDAAAAFQQAVTLKPSVNLYNGLATNLANAGATATDPKVADSKFAEASSDCDKAIALDPVAGATCWKNLGIVLSNKGRMKEAVAPLQKAAQAEPKDQVTWYLLGSALTAEIDTKQEGEKMIYIIPPGTADAYQKCIDNGPDNSTGKLCKGALDGLNAMSGGQDTSVGKKKKK